MNTATEQMGQYKEMAFAVLPAAMADVSVVRWTDMQ
jgi:hypothetical protein